MADQTVLFMLKGLEENLPNDRVPGRIYYCIDTNNIFIDEYDTATGLPSRKQINANKAKYLKSDNETLYIDDNEISLGRINDESDYEGNSGGAGLHSVAIGKDVSATGSYSQAFGTATVANQANAHAEGSSSVASGASSHAEGAGAKASGQYSHAEGYKTKAIGDSSHAEGDTTTASGHYSHAEGLSTTASDCAHAEGGGTIASGAFSHAEGMNTIASGEKAHSEGCETKASAAQAHSEGYTTKASGVSSHAEGTESHASGDNSHAEGKATTASGYISHAEGFSTTASGEFSHAEGAHTIAYGNATHAGGYGAKAEGNYSFAHGFRVVAQNPNSSVFGKYNFDDGSGNIAFSIGNGTDNTDLSNAMSVNWDGSAKFAGPVNAADPIDNYDVATKHYVDEKIPILTVHTKRIEADNTTEIKFNGVIDMYGYLAYYNGVLMVQDENYLVQNPDTIILNGWSAKAGDLITITGKQFTDVNEQKAVLASRLANVDKVGTSTKPVYFSEYGVPVACDPTLDVNITGSSNTAELATTANKLSNTTAIGSTTNPVFFNANGVPEVCVGPLALSITGNAATATNATNAVNADVATQATTATTATRLSTASVGSTTLPVYIDANGVPAACSTNLAVNASTATALTTSAGSTSQPVYFASGKPVAIDWRVGSGNIGEHNCNNITYNFSGYYTANGPTTGIGASTADGAIWSQAYSSSWVAQIAQDYRDGDLFVRGKNNGTWTAWKRMWATGDAVTGAVWNDYAECRESDTIEPGYVLIENGDDTLSKSTERLQPFAGVSSDTWGFSQGETEKAKTPIAVAGRVLVYPYQDRNNYKPGDCVCAAAGGTVDIMTREEVALYPDRIVGTVSCVPTYEKWGGGEMADRDPVDVNGRIWIKVR